MSETRPPRLAWSWSTAALGLIDAIPALVVIPFDVAAGLGLAFGVLPAALIGVLPVRRQRARVIPVGVLTAVSIFLGSLVANTHALALLTIFAVALGAAFLTTRLPFGRLVLTLGVPMVGIGLSFTDEGKGAVIAGLIVAGTLYSYVVSLLWPERPAPPAAPAPLPPQRVMLEYGIRLGLAGVTAAALGFAFDLDHVGWQVAAALLVMRPVEDMQRLRSIGRIVSVTLGAFLAAAMAALSPADGWYSLAIAVTLTAAAATRASRWYVTPLFTTFIAISLLLYSRPEDTAYRFNQRVIETLVGVGIAYFFGLLLPRVLQQAKARRPTGAGDSA